MERPPVRPDNATLAARPEQFRHARSTAKTVVFAVLAAVALVALAVVLVNFEAIRDDAGDMTGRRSGLRGIVAPAAVVLCAFFAFVFGWFAISGSHAWERTETGTRLKPRYFTVDGGGDVADALHARFATGDPAQYLPVPNHRKGAIRVAIYRADADRLGFVTIQVGKGAAARGWPLITMRDRAFVQLKQLAPEDFSRRHGGSGTIDPLLNG
ncbi:hypothetical protein GE115_15925 [Agromyces sp. CFH 90414]|uniref:Uncharacterized protein n=1 Tax=Agromyces agglutinans TaxID=2662258 RepID=A0A6I2F788_9MICO|nr:hypothetical protein [Agromyces agglutinans]MRG61345.1 hypothetical protein [Agromyces agglutinans]